MPRTVREAKLESRTARSRLAVRGKPYWRAVQPSLHIGYRKGKKGGRWVARLYAGDQSYRVETLGTADDALDADGVTVLSFAQAQEAARAWFTRQAREAASDEPAASKRPVTVGDALDAYIKKLEAEGSASLREVRSRAAWMRPQLGRIELERLTAERLRKWLQETASAPRRVRTKAGTEARYLEAADTDEARRARRSTANRIWTTLRAALNHAFSEGKVSSDAAWRRVKPFQGADSARLRFLSVDEAKRLMNACEPAFRDLVAAALATGARYGELCRLEVGDYDPDAGVIVIRQSKSGRPRHIYLTDEGRALFDRLTAGRPNREPMLLKANGEPWKPSEQTRPMKAAEVAARIDPPAGFHGLRHTYASLSVMNGAPLPVIAHNLGHSTTRMVDKHYGHLAPSYVADTTRRTAPTFGLGGDEKVAKLRSNRP